MRFGRLLLLGASLSCRKSHPPKVVYDCSVSAVTAPNDQWAINLSVNGAASGRGRVIATLFDVDPHRSEPNRTRLCTLEREVTWNERRANEFRSTPAPSCTGQPPWGHYRMLTIELVPLDPAGAAMGCSYNYYPPRAYGGEKTIEAALEEVGAPIMLISFLPTSGNFSYVFLRVPATWMAGAFPTEAANADMIARFGPDSAWAKTNALKMHGSRPLTPEEIKQPMWADARFQGSQFFELDATGKLEKRGPAFGPIIPSPR